MGALPPLFGDRIIAWRRAIHGVRLIGQPHKCYPREVDGVSMRGYDLSSALCTLAATERPCLLKMNKVTPKASWNGKLAS